MTRARRRTCRYWSRSRRRTLLPGCRSTGRRVCCSAPTDCVIEDPAHELAPPERGYPVLTTIIAIDLRNPGIGDTLCYSEVTGGVYVSPHAIYLTQSDYDPARGAADLVHRFDYREALKYRGSGKVTGYLHAGAIRIFVSAKVAAICVWRLPCGRDPSWTLWSISCMS